MNVNKFQRTLTTESGNKYIIYMVNPIKGITLMKKLAKIVLPIIGGAVDGLNHDEDEFGPSKTFSQIADKVVQNLEGDDIETLVPELLQGAAVVEPGDIPKDLDMDFFRGNYSEMMEVVLFSIKENFGDAFKGKGIGHRLTDLVTKAMGQIDKE